MGRYEEILQVKGIPEAIQDANGDWVQGSETDFKTVSYCRDEPNDSGKTITGAEGEQITFSSIIQLPEDCPEIKRGEKIRILNESGEIILEGSALRFKRYRKNSRLWVEGR